MTSESYIPDTHAGKYSKDVNLGSGSFGVVYKGKDNRNNKPVALKCFTLSNYFKLAYRELCVLQYIDSHYLLKLLDVYLIVQDGIPKELWLVTPLMDYDFHAVLYKDNMMFSFENIIKIMYQMLKALKYLSDAGIIHRDLKPSNVGINKDHSVRLMDFGSARDAKDVMSAVVQTVNYRAIEVCIGEKYTSAIDMWSAGCMFAELFTKKILFKARNAFGQPKEIIRITGLPDDGIYPDLSSYKDVAPKTNKLREYISGDIKRIIIPSQFGNEAAAENVINLICSMLEINPAKRPTPEAALKLFLFAQFHCFVKDYPDDKKPDIFHCDCDNNDNKLWQDKLIDKVKRCASKE